MRFDFTKKVKIPRIIFAMVMPRKISVGHIRDVLSVDADVPSRVVDVRLHHGGYPLEINKKNTAQK